MTPRCDIHGHFMTWCGSCRERWCRSCGPHDPVLCRQRQDAWVNDLTQAILVKQGGEPVSRRGWWRRRRA